LYRHGRWAKLRSSSTMHRLVPSIRYVRVASLRPPQSFRPFLEIHMNIRFPRFLLAAALTVATTSAFAAPVTYKMDPAHTDVIAQWSHFGYSNPIAQFGQVDGTIVYDADNIATSSVEVTLPMSGMSSHVGAYDDHLRSAELFDVANFPEA